MQRLVRSVLFTPGDRIQALRKSLTLATDVVIFDLEDAVGPAGKDTARANAIEVMSEQGLNKDKGRSPDIVLRVNCPFTTPWGKADLIAAAAAAGNGNGNGNSGGSALTGLILPKVEDAARVEELVAEYSLKVPIWCMVETAKGVINSERIAAVEPVQALVFGSNDLTKDLAARHTPSREPLLYSMSKVILAARAEGKMVIDGVHMDLKDLEGMVRACVQGRSLGFDGKSLIHPSQVPFANDGYSPSNEEIEHARRLVRAYEEAEAGGKGVTVVDDRLVEKLHVEAAILLLHKAAQIADSLEQQ